MHHFIFSPVYIHDSSICFTSLPPLGDVSLFKNFSYSDGRLGAFTVVSICMSLTTNDIDYLFMYFLAICVSSFANCSYVLPIYFKRLVIFFVMDYKCPLHIMSISLFVR